MESQPPAKIVPLKPPDAQEVKSRLLQNLPYVLRALLPAGVVRGQKFMVGNVAGDAGDSLIVELSGSKAGLWHDFATGAGGDVLDLWAAIKGFDRQSQFPALLQDIQNQLGAGFQERSPVRPSPAPKLGKPTAKWDYTDAQGILIASVYRYDPRPGQKEFRPWDALRGVMRAPEIRPLYNQVGMKTADAVVLVEGEKCAAALVDLGICATTAMNGAKAPIDKTDWSPLKGKRVTIWPDNDEAGQIYARNAASAAARAGAVSVEILKIPPDKPAKWDAADAVAEGLDIHAILKNWERMVAKEVPPPRKTLPLYSIAELQRDQSPIPDDLIAPRVLTPGGLLVLGGAPKVGKSDFLISLLAHMAGGAPFLGMSSARPLRIFYLQAEVQYHYLRERVQRLAMSDAATLFLDQNFILTPQISITLNDAGIALVCEAVKDRFKDMPPDIIAIDPLRNVFDGGSLGGENDNDAMMFFLAQRLEELRRRINPDAGIILAHHTRKAFKKTAEEDPFQALSGAGALRSYYSSGIILHRVDEKRPERLLIFELRNGPEIPAKTILRRAQGWVEADIDLATLMRQQEELQAQAENIRKTDTIIRLIFDEAKHSRIYTANQFAESFENKEGLGSARTIRDRISALATKGYVKFFKNADAYGLPLLPRSRQGYVCVDGMTLKSGALVMATHMKHPETGEIIPIADLFNGGVL
ncbi:MAG: AAA family ATPase [Alphaproteobacteria bacterium]|nr:AAA family ATPase [Alphaproteobacteria bacterium]